MKLREIKSAEPDKGHYKELVEFARYLRGELQPPIPLWQMVQATELSFKVEEMS